MDASQSLYVGFDLCNDVSQISCFHPRSGELETIGGKLLESCYFIPTVLGVTQSRKEWLFGENAVAMAEQGQGVLVDNLIDTISSGETFMIYGVRFEGPAILEKFLKKSLFLLNKYYPNDRIKKLVITIEQLNPILMESIYEALERLGIKKDRAEVKSHIKSYLHYALSQKKELWKKNVGLFDFRKSGFYYYQININQNCTPKIIGITEKDYTSLLSYDMLSRPESKEHMQGLFKEVINNALHKQEVSTIYITGAGFEGSWADKPLLELCRQRRVFKGQNIYNQGACYLARELDTREFSKEFLFLSRDTINSFISIRIYKDGRIQDLELIHPGQFWNEAKAEVSFIFDEEEEIQLLVRGVLEREGNSRLVQLDGLPCRPNKMGRFKLSLSFLDAKTLVVFVKDLGFGEFAPNTSRIWEKIIEI